MTLRETRAMLRIRPRMLRKTEMLRETVGTLRKKVQMLREAMVKLCIRVWKLDKIDYLGQQYDYIIGTPRQKSHTKESSSIYKQLLAICIHNVAILSSLIAIYMLELAIRNP